MTRVGSFVQEYGVRTASVVIIDTVESVATKERLGQERVDAVYRSVEVLLRKAVSRSGGQTVKGLGDGVLAMFPSASSALRAACSAFQAVAEFNRTSMEPVGLRAGVAVGDIASVGDDVTGLAVDEASRLQSEAERDGILLTAETYLLARGRTDCVFVEGPVLALKGIGHSVQSYRLDWVASPTSSELEVQLPDALGAELRSRFPFANRRAETKALGIPVLGDPASLVILRGPSGIGKTRLLAEWAERARCSGVFVFYCNAERSATSSTRDLAGSIREFLTSLAHARLLASSSAYRHICDELAAGLAPHGDDSGPGTEHGTVVERRTVVERLVRFFAHLGSDSPIVFIVDSVQYASAATLDFIGAVLQSSVANVRVICAATTDLGPDEIAVSDNELLDRFHLSERVQTLDLAPLDLDGVIEWLERQPMVTLRKEAPVPLDAIGRDIAAAFFEASGGNPNVLGLVIRDSYDLERLVSMDDDGRWRAQCDVNALRRSQSAERLVQSRLVRLSPAERELVDISSVVGGEIDIDLVRRVSGRDVPEVDHLLDAARSRHFIREFGGLERFETEATRRAIYHILPPTRRAEWHAAVARALGDRSSDGKTLVPEVQIARHLSAAAAIDGNHASDAAVHFLRAARRVTRTEPADAVSLAHEALAILDKFELIEDGQLRSDAHRTLADAQDELGHSGSQLSRELADSLRGRPPGL